MNNYQRKAYLNQKEAIKKINSEFMKRHPMITTDSQHETVIETESILDKALDHVNAYEEDLLQENDMEFYESDSSVMDSFLPKQFADEDYLKKIEDLMIIGFPYTDYTQIDFY